MSRSEPEGTTMSARTPGPWHVADRGIGWEVHVGPRPSEGCWRATGPWCVALPDGFRETFSREDAEFIVTACNAYDADRALIAELKDALRDLIDVAGDHVDTRLCTTAELRKLNAARAALSRVKEGA